MDHLVSIFLILAAGLPIAFLSAINRWIFLPVLLAFSSRVATAILHRYVVPLPQGSADALAFDRVAISWASQYGCTGFFEHYNPSASYVYSSVIATIYACVDYVPFSVQIINVLMGVYGIIFLVFATKEVWGERYARRVGVILALFPFLIIFSSVGLRETFIFLGFSLGIYFLVLFHNSRGIIFFILSVIMFQFSALFHGAMALAIGALFLGLSWKPLMKPNKTKQQFGLALIAFLTMMALMVFGAIYAYANLSLHKLGSLEQLDVDQIANIAASRSQGSAAYLSGFQINSFTDFVIQSPIRLVYFLFSPFPWNISHPLHLMGLFDGLFYMFVFYLCFKYRKRVFEHPATLQILIIVLVLAFAFSFGTSNFGTATRHRAKFALAMLVIVAPCFYSSFRKRSN
ncbi:hypothetical protein [Marinobacter nauticus]|uniref:Glycosyltransferase RgtA/B/C/D-like domain-containing protein n=1 Tax=Marinobacter nauticus TaxID=2743 RepID=A0A1M2UX36_MARNT|nr:hypothetical protein [Marinobacter nauticus]OJS99857.1 hypothetical protein BEE62_07000 [Marinobacter nauticus]